MDNTLRESGHLIRGGPAGWRELVYGLGTHLFSAEEPADGTKIMADKSSLFDVTSAPVIFSAIIILVGRNFR